MRKRFARARGRVALEVNDYVVRAAVQSRADGPVVTFEAPMPSGVIVQGEIDEPDTLSDVLAEQFAAWGIAKGSDVRFFVSDEAILARSIDVNDADESYEDLLTYVTMEIGQTIHVPFEEPTFDVFPTNEEETKGTLFVAPAAPVTLLANALLDLKMKPSVADIKMLGLARTIRRMGELTKRDVPTLVANWGLNGLTVAIFRNSVLEFLRFQQFHNFREQWTVDPELADGAFPYTLRTDPEQYELSIGSEFGEIGNIMNSYRFSLHKGEHHVEQILLTGDNPQLDLIERQLTLAYGETPIERLKETRFSTVYPNVPIRFAPLVGLFEREDV